MERVFVLPHIGLSVSMFFVLPSALLTILSSSLRFFLSSAVLSVTHSLTVEDGVSS